MKIIMELDRTETELGIGGDQLRDLETCGVADSEVLKACWKEFLVSGIEFHHLCLMLQAYCLIYPVKMATSTSEKTTTQQYIIPCKLPNEICLPEWACNCISFYFNFAGFLPDVIYHRLICLASSESKLPLEDRNDRRYSSKMCIFYDLIDTNWMIEIERHEQRLKVVV